MNVNTGRTETFIRDDLPQMVMAAPDQAEAAYVEYLAQIKEVAGDKPAVGASTFDWQCLYESVDEFHGSPERRLETAGAARRTSFIHPNPVDVSPHVLLHGPEGAFLTVDARSGRAIAAERVESPMVPEMYGDPDPYVLGKIGEAVVAEALTRQGADWGEGYKFLTWLKRRYNGLAADARPHIGMATLHEIPCSDETAGTDRHALAYSSTSGRILAARARLVICQYYPDIAARMVNGVDGPEDPDDLAGVIDTWSGAVANRVALNLPAAAGPSGHLRFVMALPDPNQPDHRLVDWN